MDIKFRNMKIHTISVVLLMIMMPLTGCVSDETKETSEADGTPVTDNVDGQDSINEANETNDGQNGTSGDDREDGQDNQNETDEEMEHPFLYLTSDRKSVIHENIQTEPMASIYAAVQERASAELVDIDTGDWDAKGHGDNAEIAVMNSFLAWLNDDEDAAKRALEAMDRLESNWDDHSAWGINIRMPGPLIHYTAAWDFLMATNFLPEEDSTLLENKITDVTQQFYAEYVLDDSKRQLALTVTQNNHPIRTAAAIGIVGLAFGEHPDATTWLDWAVSELDYLLGPDGQYIQPDGAISEGPFYFNYGFAPTIAFFIALENRQSEQHIYSRNCINRAEVDPWIGHNCVDGEEFTFSNPMQSELFHSVMDWSLSLRLPNGNRAPIADSPLRNQNGPAIFPYFGAENYLYWDWASNPSDPYKVKGGFELFIQHLAYVEPMESAGPPQWKNRFFIDGGMATFRSGWDQDDRVLILMGENGSARKTIHDHTDGTSFIMAAYGELLLTDTGYYKPNEFQNAVTAGAGSHNLILVEGDEVPEKGLLNNWGDADAFIENTLDGTAIAYAESRQNYPNTEVVRGVAFLRERYFVVVDRLESQDDVEREYRFRLHAHAGHDLDGNVSLGKHGPLIERESGSVAVYTQASQGQAIVEEPTFQEYAAPHVHKLVKDAEHHTVTDSVITGVAPDFLSVLAPFKTGESSGTDGPFEVTQISTEHGVAWYIVGENSVDIAWVREFGAPTELFLPTNETLTTDAAFVWMSLDKSLALMVEGTELHLDDETVLTSSDADVVAVKQ